MGYLIVIICYLGGLIVYGVYKGKKEVKNAEDFTVAGRRLPFIVLVGTLLATWCGGGGITGSASFVYTYGPYAGILHFISAPIGILLLYFIAGRVRKSEKVTIPEIFETRYGDTARILSAVCIILAYVGIVSAQFKAVGFIISMTTGLDVNVATILAALAIVALTVSGGMVAVAYSDAYSALLMVGGFFLAAILLFGKLGGLGAAFSSLPAGKSTLTGGLSGIKLLGYMLPTMFLILGDQNMMQRFSAAKDQNVAKKSNIGMFVGEIVVIVLTILIVVAGILLIPDTKRPDTIIFQLALQKMPFVMGAIVLSACVAFIVTTGDSFLLSAATNLTYDIWGKYLKKDATDKQTLTFLRGTVVAFAVIAYLLCMYFPTILSVQMYSYTMYGAAITPALLCALFSRKVTKAAGICGILTGAVLTILWDAVLKSPQGIKSALISVPASFLVILVVTVLTKKKENQSYSALYKEG